MTGNQQGVYLQEKGVVTVSTEQKVGLSDGTDGASWFEKSESKVHPKFVLSVVVVLWVAFVMAAYFSQYLQPLCTLWDVPVLCTL